jgi:predicted transcriptional regulator
MNCEGSINKKTISGKQMADLKKHLEFPIGLKLNQIQVQEHHVRESLSCLEKQSMAVLDNSKCLIGCQQKTEIC